MAKCGLETVLPGTRSCLLLFGKSFVNEYMDIGEKISHDITNSRGLSFKVFGSEVRAHLQAQQKNILAGSNTPTVPT